MVHIVYYGTWQDPWTPISLLVSFQHEQYLGSKVTSFPVICVFAYLDVITRHLLFLFRPVLVTSYTRHSRTKFMTSAPSRVNPSKIYFTPSFGTSIDPFLGRTVFICRPSYRDVVLIRTTRLLSFPVSRTSYHRSLSTSPSVLHFPYVKLHPQTQNEIHNTLRSHPFTILD